jgi:hypothetical protein
VIDRRQDRPTDEDLSPRVALAFGMTGACDETVLFGPQTGETFI